MQCPWWHAENREGRRVCGDCGLSFASLHEPGVRGPPWRRHSHAPGRLREDTISLWQGG